MVNKFKDEVTYLFWIGLVISVLVVSFNAEIGNVYMGLLFIDLLLLFGIKRKIFTNAISGNTIKSMFNGIIAYGGLVLIYFLSSFFLQGFTSVAQPSFQQMISYIQTQSVLALEKSRLLEIFAIGILIPVIETKVIFGSAFEFLAQQTKTNIERFNGRLLVLILVLSGIFTWFHISVRGVSNVGWFVTFIFGIISCVLVVRSKEIESATWFHIFNNLIIKLKGG